MLADVVKRKGCTAGSLGGWGWRELKVLPVSWYDELARILTMVEDVGAWAYGLLAANRRRLSCLRSWRNAPFMS